MGCGKLCAPMNTAKEFAPDDYVYEKGRFDTLEEALEFVQHMNMEAENPFS